jgi:predicted AlkP superfamily pyrophosphatase or phosphodiesterase
MSNYKHVIVVGIDGAGSFFEQADTPAFDRIFSSGAVTYHALASNPTISAECWGSMLLGVSPKVHGLTNSIVDRNPYPHDSAWPSLFQRIREVMPDAKLGSFCEWSPITRGIVENNLGVDSDSAPDTELAPRIADYIRKQKPVFLFVQMDSIDGAGHSFGYGSPQHLKRISEVDSLIDMIYQATKDAGMLDDTLFCVISDHGGTPGGSHGGWTDAEKYVTFAAAGKTVRKGTIPEMNIRDLAAIVLYALGIAAPVFQICGWTSQIPQGLFDDENIPEYRDISGEDKAEPRISKTPRTSEPV